MRILVTGAGGNVGQSVAAGLVCAGHEAIGICRNHMPKNASYPVIRLDLSRERPDIQNVDAVIHIAAALNGTAKQLIYDNIKATENLISYAEQMEVKRFVYLSTVSVHGRSDGELSEESGRKDAELYGVTKYLSECLVGESSIPEKIVLRLPRMLGPFTDMKHTKGSGFLTMAKKIIDEEDVTCFIPGIRYNNFLHVEELEKFLEILLTKQEWEGAQIFLLGAKERLTMLDVLKIMKDEAGSSSKILAEEKEGTVPNCSLINTERAEAYGFSPDSAEHMLRRFVRDIWKQRKEPVNESV